MALIRITQASQGIEDYLETGIKVGREQTRDQLDKRVPLWGDLNCFRKSCEYSRNTKDWKHHYWHFTNSFSYEDGQISTKILREMVAEMLAYYCCGYNVNDEIIAYAEAHYPRHQSIENKQDNNLEQRLIHIHLAVSKVNRLTDLQIRLLPFNSSADLAFQSYLNLKYHLINSIDRRREKALTKKDFFARMKADNSQKTTAIGFLREQFTSLLVGISSLKEAEAILLKQQNVASIHYKTNRRAGVCLQVIMHDAEIPAINLRGRGFEAFESLNKQHNGDEVLQQQNVFQSHSDQLEALQSIFVKHMHWHRADVEQRMSEASRLPYNKIEAHLKMQYEQFSKNLERKIFYSAYAKEDQSSGTKKHEPERHSQSPSNQLRGAGNNNPIKALLASLRDQKFYKNKKTIFEDYNERIPSQKIVMGAVENYGVIGQFFNNIDENKIQDRRLPSQKLSNCKFLHDVCNLDYVTINDYCAKTLADAPENHEDESLFGGHEFRLQH